jgi:lipopolysaccharide transport system ATP-binding protein
MITVIKVENLSKAYSLGQIGGRTLSQDLNRAWARHEWRKGPRALAMISNLGHS